MHGETIKLVSVSCHLLRHFTLVHKVHSLSTLVTWSGEGDTSESRRGGEAKKTPVLVWNQFLTLQLQNNHLTYSLSMYKTIYTITFPNFYSVTIVQDKLLIESFCKE